MWTLQALRSKIRRSKIMKTVVLMHPVGCGGGWLDSRTVSRVVEWKTYGRLCQSEGEGCGSGIATCDMTVGQWMENVLKMSEWEWWESEWGSVVLLNIIIHHVSCVIYHQHRIFLFQICLTVMSDNDDPDTWHKRSFSTFEDTDCQNWTGEWFFPYSKLFRIYIERI